MNKLPWIRPPGVRLAQWFRGLVLCLLAWTALGASAKTLMLTTADTYAIDNAVAEFFGSAPLVANDPRGTVLRDVLTTPNGIDASTFTAAPGPYDLVVVVSVYSTVDPTNWAVLQSAISGRLANAFVFFVDGCCNAANGNVSGFVPLLNGVTGLSMSVGAYVDGPLQFALNTSSPYSTEFSGLNPLSGGWVNYIDGVPYANALYLPTGVPPTVPAPTPPAPTTAFGVLFPQTSVNGGAGACVFGVLDATIMDSNVAYPANQGKIGPAFEAAAAVGSNACRVTTPPGGTATPQNVPTLSPWAMLLLVAGAAGLAARHNRRAHGGKTSAT